MPSAPLLHLWTLRLGWLGLPLTVGPTLEDALQTHSTAVLWLSAVSLWALWGLGLLSLLVIKPMALTGIRVLAVAAFAASLAAAVDGEVSALALIWSAAVFGWSLLSTIGGLYVDGGSYGDERRLALKVPGQLLLGPIPVVTLGIVLGAAAGPIALAAQAWILGAILLIVGWAAASQGLRILHQLTQRWLVFVPAGIVVVDHMQLMDPLRIVKSNLDSIGLADANTTAVDLTYGSLGSALEIALVNPEPIILRTGEVISVSATIVTPSRMQDAFAEATRRELPVEASS